MIFRKKISGNFSSQIPMRAVEWTISPLIKDDEEIADSCSNNLEYSMKDIMPYSYEDAMMLTGNMINNNKVLKRTRKTLKNVQ